MIRSRSLACLRRAARRCARLHDDRHPARAAATRVRYVYSGTRKDLEIMGPAFLRLSMGWVILTLIDLPFSLRRGHAAAAGHDLARRAALEGDRGEDAGRDRPPRARSTPRRARRRRHRAASVRRVPSSWCARQDPQLADCYSVDARDHHRRRAGAARRRSTSSRLREAIAHHQDDGHQSLDWREPVFEVEGERVRIRATRAQHARPVARARSCSWSRPAPDGGWRIVEETSVGWPEQ